MKRLVLALLIFLPRPAVAGEDDQVPPPPPVAPTIPPPPVTPVMPPPAPAPVPAIDESRLAALIDQAVQRALARCGSLPSASGQAMAPSPAPVVPSVNVVVPAPACRQLLARLGQWLTKLGQPRIRTLPLAPAAPVRAAPQSF